MSTTQPRATVATTPPTAWQSLPPLIRFAAWVWAIGTVIAVGVGWLIVVLVWGLS
jgi:hypothetical protein